MKRRNPSRIATQIVALVVGLAGCEGEPAFAPGAVASDGLVFVRRGVAGADLWRVRIADGAERPLLTTAGVDESWPLWNTTDGRLLYEARPVGARDARLYLLAPRNPVPTRLTDRPLDLESWGAWSEDGARIAFGFREAAGLAGVGGVAEVRLSTGTRVVRSPLKSGVTWFRPEYAADGATLLVQKRRGPPTSPSELWLLGGDSPPRRLPLPRAAHYQKARFSGDGESILFTRQESPNALRDVLRFDLETGRISDIAALASADEHSSRGAPGGGAIAYISNLDGSPDLFVLDVGSGKARNLSRTPGLVEAAPRWSPDGARLVVSVFAPGEVLSLEDGARPDRPGTRVHAYDRHGHRLLDTDGSMADWMPPF